MGTTFEEIEAELARQDEAFERARSDFAEAVATNPTARFDVPSEDFDELEECCAVRASVAAPLVFGLRI